MMMMMGPVAVLDSLASKHSHLAMVVGLAVPVIYTLWYRYCLQRGCKGPKAWPIVGASVDQIMNYDRLHDYLLSYLQELDTVSVKMPFGYTFTHTTNPDNVEHILKSNFANYPKGKHFHEVMEALLGDGIFNSDGELWRQQRKTASFEFASQVLRNYSTVVFREYAQKLARILDQAGQISHPIDMQNLFMRLTLDSICKIGFGVDLGSLSPLLPDVPFATAFDKANYSVTLRFSQPLWKLKRLLNLGTEAQLKESLKVIDDFTYNLIKSRRTEMAALRASQSERETKPDILSRFIVLSEDPESKLNDKSLRDVVLNFVIAGRDTTAVTLSWFTYMLSQHEEVAAKIYRELCEFEKRESKARQLKTDTNMDLDGRITEFAKLLNYDTIVNLPYLHASISETLRLYPAVPLDPKGILADDILPSGMKVRKGHMVTYSPFCMGRSKKLWGEDALSFKPERWLNDGVYQPVSPFKFTTFQAGPRICIGKDSAFLQMKITAAILGRFFMFSVIPAHPVKYQTMAILAMAHGLKVRVSDRH